MIKKHTETEA